MRLRHTAAVVVLAAGLSLPLAGGAAAADLGCDDFASQAEAQAVLVADPTDPHDLDRNGNGTACEDTGYPAAGTVPAPVREVPAGAVDAGDGSATAGSVGELPLTLAGLAVASAGAALVARRRAA